MTKTLALADIRIDGDTQPRTRIEETLVSDYAEAMEAGATFPPVIVFFDGVRYWLADGFHRFHAANRLEQKTIKADVQKGTQRDAVLFSCGANATHGNRRTNEDKRKAVYRLLEDDEWIKWSDGQVARQCAVSAEMVRGCRQSISQTLEDAPPTPTTRTVKRGDTTYQQDTTNIGGKSNRDPKAGPPPIQVTHEILSIHKADAEQAARVLLTNLGAEYMAHVMSEVDRLMPEYLETQ